MEDIGTIQSHVDPTVAEIITHDHKWQLCPKCNGQGLISKPPWISGDVNYWMDVTTAAHCCDLCDGKKIISSITGRPPQ